CCWCSARWWRLIIYGDRLRHQGFIIAAVYYAVRTRNQHLTRATSYIAYTSYQPHTAVVSLVGDQRCIRCWHIANTLYFDCCWCRVGRAPRRESGERLRHQGFIIADVYYAVRTSNHHRTGATRYMTYKFYPTHIA